MVTVVVANHPWEEGRPVEACLWMEEVTMMMTTTTNRPSMAATARGTRVVVMRPFAGEGASNPPKK